MIGLAAVIGFIVVNAALAPMIGVLGGLSLGEWWRS